MPIKFDRFGNGSTAIDLTQLYEGEEFIGTGPAREAYLPLSSGGMFDLLGGERAPRAATPITIKGELVAATAAALQTAYYALRARARQRDRLYRRRADGTVEWLWARLNDLPDSRVPDHTLYLPVALNFTGISPYWYGAHRGAWTLDSGVYLDSGYILDAGVSFPISAGANSFSVPTGGHTRVQEVILRLTAGNANITAVTIRRYTSGTEINEFTWTGTLTVGKTLVIDTGALAVTNDGSDAYSGFTLTSNHTIDDWLRLEPGSNTFLVTLTGGGAGSTISFEFYDAWE